MKKTLLMVAAVAMMAFTACNKENIIGGNEVETPTEDSVVSPVSVVEFTASFGATKTALDKAGEKTLWVETDRIDINGQEFKIKELVDGGLAAKFENVNELPANFAAPFTAKYPYGVAEVPATQTAYAGTFDPTAVLETATSDDHNLSFTNVTSLLKFQVLAGCQTVTISSDDVLAGSNAKTVTVNGPFEAGKTYYAAVLPGTKANFVVRIDGYLSKNATSVTIDESTIANMQDLPEPESFEWGLVGKHQGWDITNPTTMYKIADKVYACLNITLQDDGFKFAQLGLTNWNTANTSFGAWKKSSNKGYFDYSVEMAEGAWYEVYTNNLGGQANNLGVTDFNQTYDVYVKVIEEADWGKKLGYTIVSSGTDVEF